MSREALARLIRVADILAKDTRQRDNQERAKEILALAHIIREDMDEQDRATQATGEDEPVHHE
jgi:hypothetical protein